MSKLLAAPIIGKSTTGTDTTATTTTTSSSSSSSLLVPGIHEGCETIGESRRLVVMLHGWAQNAMVFRHRTRTLTKKLTRHGMDCLFLAGPIVLPPITVLGPKQEPNGMETSSSDGRSNDDTTHQNMVGRQDARAWFLYQQDDNSNDDHDYWQSGKPIEYVGLEESLRLLEGELTRISPKACPISILGFSQGAVLTHIVASLATSRGWPWNRIQGCILVGGFSAAPLHWPEEQLSGLSMRSLHVIGSKDIRVPPDLGHKLAEKFENAVIFEHDKGHIVPQQTASCLAIVTFVQKSNDTGIRQE